MVLKPNWFVFPIQTQTAGGLPGPIAITRQDSWIIDRIEWHIRTMLLIISTLSFLYTTLPFIYSAFIHISFSHSFNFVVLITRCLFKSWQNGATFLLLLLFLWAPGEAHNLSTLRISIAISARSPAITLINEMMIKNPTTSLFGHHPGQ